MIIESLNIGLPKKETFHGREIITGICKTPVSGPLNLTAVGFDDDGVGNLNYHGGLDKAVCVYSRDHYPYWEELLGEKLPEAAFGENLSVSGLLEYDICIGDIFEAGTALLQVSQPRQPCGTLSLRFGRDDMITLVRDSGFTGFYFRVLRTGRVKKGDQLQLKEKDKNGVTIAFANNIYYHQNTDCNGIERVLAVDALSASWRRSFQNLRANCR